MVKWKLAYLLCHCKSLPTQENVRIWLTHTRWNSRPSCTLWGVALSPRWQLARLSMRGGQAIEEQVPLEECVWKDNILYSKHICDINQKPNVQRFKAGDWWQFVQLNPERDYVTTCEDAAKHLKIVNEALDLLANYRDGRYNTATRYRSSRRRNTTTRR